MNQQAGVASCLYVGILNLKTTLSSHPHEARGCVNEIHTQGIHELFESIF